MVLREALGADVLVHFMVKAPAVITEDVKELAHDVGAEALEAVERGAQAGETEFMARLNPRTKAAKGDEIELVDRRAPDALLRSGYGRRHLRGQGRPSTRGRDTRVGTGGVT